MSAVLVTEIDPLRLALVLPMWKGNLSERRKPVALVQILGLTEEDGYVEVEVVRWCNKGDAYTGRAEVIALELADV